MRTEVLKKTRRRDTSLPKGRQINDNELSVIKTLLLPIEKKRDLLIEALHLIQDKYGCLRPDHLNSVAVLFKLSQAEVFEVASFYHHFHIIEDNAKFEYKTIIRICDGLSCELSGSENLFRKVSSIKFPKGVRVEKVPCIGRCASAPAANISKFSIEHANVEKIVKAVDSNQDAKIPNYQEFDHYVSEGGYDVLKKILNEKLDEEKIISMMSDSGLRGLGGAGFPAGRKWKIVKSYNAPRLMTINGDEGEPGTFKDRFWLESKPHLMLEGALIAAKIVGCSKIYIYMRDEYPSVIEILKREITKLEQSGLTNHAPFELRRGAGAYICGEESAMIESIEGKRGLPRQRPPYIAEVGLFGRPTLNHNVETLCWVPQIIKKGVPWFTGLGKGEHNGLRSYSVSGRVKNPGVKIAPAGTTVQELLDEFSGGMLDGHKFKAFLPGGASGGIFPKDFANLPLDFGSFEKHGGFIGSHAVVFLSNKDSIKDVALNLMKFFKHESCGQCTPCRSGTEKMVKILEKDAIDLDLISDLKEVMTDSSICGLGQAASNPVNQLIKFFPGDF